MDVSIFVFWSRLEIVGYTDLSLLIYFWIILKSLVIVLINIFPCGFENCVQFPRDRIIYSNNHIPWKFIIIHNLWTSPFSNNALKLRKFNAFFLKKKHISFYSSLLYIFFCSLLRLCSHFHFKRRKECSNNNYS